MYGASSHVADFFLSRGGAKGKIGEGPKFRLENRKKRVLHYRIQHSNKLSLGRR